MKKPPSKLEVLCAELLRVVYVGDSKIVCPIALALPLRAIMKELNAIAANREGASMTEQLKLRPEVAQCAQEMERVLRENDHKGGWKRDPSRWLYEKLLNEVQELLYELVRKPCSPQAILKEAVDVANFAMMIADVAGGLKDGGGS